MTEFSHRLAGLGPEIVMLIGACACLLMGLAERRLVRVFVPLAACATLGVAAVCVQGDAQGALTLAGYAKLAILGMGLLLLLLAASMPEQTDMEGVNSDASAAFNPGVVVRGEFYAFFLFSLTGAMLCAGARDLVWLFLALELTSLPTYVMIAIAHGRSRSQESAVKYFYLGAMAAAVFLYGFTLIYGATGATEFAQIRASVASMAYGGVVDGATGVPALLIVGLVLAVLGVAFKIAAVPMHFYTADVYQGAAVPVTAFLAFVPKTAGFLSLVALLGLIQPLAGDERALIEWLIWLLAAATMCVGNTLGLLQDSVKRVMAYSSIAHSGYMLVGLLALSGVAGTGSTLGNGVAAILFYLVAYGLANLTIFAVLGCLQKSGSEADTYDDLAGLARAHPGLGVVMVIGVLSLVGLPPMIGFLGKIYLFGTAVEHGYTGLVVIAVLNSAVSAVYYLRIVAACYFREPTGRVTAVAAPAQRLSAGLAALAVLVFGLSGGWLVEAAGHAGDDSQRQHTERAAYELPRQALFLGDSAHLP